MRDSSSPSGADRSSAIDASAATRRRPRRTRPIEWLVVAIATVAAVALFNARGHYGPGTIVDAPITLVTSDRNDLGCAARAAFGRYRCGYQAADRPWPDPPAPADLLAPYYTGDRRLFLIPGLFEQPAVAARYRREIPTGRSRASLRRFVADCKVRLLTRAEGFEVRWVRGDGWHPSGPGWVAAPVRCSVQDK